jgi:hypothetical protein
MIYSYKADVYHRVDFDDNEFIYSMFSLMEELHDYEPEEFASYISKQVTTPQGIILRELDCLTPITVIDPVTKKHVTFDEGFGNTELTTELAKILYYKNKDYIMKKLVKLGLYKPTDDIKKSKTLPKMSKNLYDSVEYMLNGR